MRALAQTLALFLFGGCLLQSEGQLMQADIKALRAQLDAVKSGIDEDREALRAAIVRAEKKTIEVQEAIDALNNSARRTDADLGIQLDALQKSVQQLTGQLEELGFKLERLEKSERTAAAPAPAGHAEATPAEERVVLPADKKQAAELVTKLLTSKETKQREDGKRLANELFAKWPKEEGTTDVVRLALGDRLVDEKQYQKAIVEYKKVLDTFPKGARADAAMFKIAQTWAALGQPTDAKVFYEELLRRFPKSIYVKDAKLKIAELDKIKAKKK